MRTFNGKLLTIAYKSNIIRFKMDEDPLQRRIYFLTFVESLVMISSQYKETCEVLLDYPKIGGGGVIEDYAKSLSESLSSDSRARKKKRTKKKNRRKHHKDDLSNPSSSDDSDFSDDSHYRRKQPKDKKHEKKYPIRLCATLT